MDGGRVPRSSGDVRGSSDGWVRLGRCLKRGGFTPAQLDGVFVFVSDLGRSYPIQLILLFERIVPQVPTAVRDRCKLLCSIGGRGKSSSILQLLSIQWLASLFDDAIRRIT
jgi:hypothetical protein